ncbi:DUF3742 family protein [Pseudomonas meliae]|uniref:DUF3742 family protein n=1 Tax=Pseudomonas meliae TaxID=86176 RepID=A0A0N8S5P5_9PSED|nr:DUF3742 family protein [Pseudomonas meliae]KPX93767.1 Uncharacterized protein ALO64_00512 [Pseudomonas meliae]
MSTKTRISIAERLGRWLGRGWRGYERCERSVVCWMASMGMPGALAAGLPWVVRLTILALLVYIAFWLALLLVFLVFLARGYEHVDLTVPEAEWRHGHAGFGLYSSDGCRIDPHDPNDPDNT